jgi:hypothetical protein
MSSQKAILRKVLIEDVVETCSAKGLLIKKYGNKE